MSVDEVASKRVLRAQFWACRFPSDERFNDFVKEDHETFYSVENDEGDGPIPVSDFVGSQGKTFFDHDFMEVGKVKNGDFRRSAILASYSDRWSDEFFRLVDAANVEPTHFIMVQVDCQPDGEKFRQFPDASSVERSDFSVIYLGEIEFEDI